MVRKHTSGQWHPIEYAGIFLVQDGETYEDHNLFDSDNFGYEQAKANAELAASAPQILESLKQAISRLEELEGKSIINIDNKAWIESGRNVIRVIHK